MKLIQVANGDGWKRKRIPDMRINDSDEGSGRVALDMKVNE